MLLFRSGRNYLELFSPLTFIAILTLYYCVIGPVFLIQEGKTFFKLVEHRPFFDSALWAAFLFVIFTIVGYSLPNKTFQDRSTFFDYADPKLVRRLTIRLFLIGLLAFFLFAGTGIVRFFNPLDTLIEEGEEFQELGGGTLSNYFYSAINFFVPSVTLMLLLIYTKGLKPRIFFLFTAIAFLIYLSVAFRYRLVFLGVSTLSAFYIFKQRKPNIIFLSLVIAGGLAFMGFVGVARTYFGGLSLDRVEQLSFKESLLEGLEESRIFMTTGLIIEKMPEEHDFLYFSPFIEALAMPIPRILWPGKPTGDQIWVVYRLIDPVRDGRRGLGAAWMLFGTFYLSFGWLGIILGSLVVGYLLRKLFSWMVRNRRDPMVIAIYAVSLSCLYFVFSRGYYPQHVLIFFFTIFPLLVIRRSIRKNGYRQFFWQRELITKQNEVLNHG